MNSMRATCRTSINTRNAHDKAAATATYSEQYTVFFFCIEILNQLWVATDVVNIAYGYVQKLHCQNIENISDWRSTISYLLCMFGSGV